MAAGTFAKASLAAAVFICGAALGAQSVKASPIVGDDYTFDFSFSPITGTALAGSGSFVALYEGGGTYDLQSIAGLVYNSSVGTSPQSITGLSPYAASDNVLYYPASTLVDFGGISFLTLYEAYNIYSNGYYGILESSSDPVGYPNSAQISLAVTPTPLPSALLLFAGGLSLVGLVKGRSRRKGSRMPAAAI
jgi:hypothetical protein